MKAVTTFCCLSLSILLLSVKPHDDRKKLLCHHWMQFASKADMSAPLKPTDKSMAKEITFKADGTYHDAIYNDQFKTIGNWYLNDDETKIALTLSTINGIAAPSSEIPPHYNTIILKLTADTLIYGDEFYGGKEGGKLVYNHSDSYFVRKD